MFSRKIKSGLVVSLFAALAISGTANAGRNGNGYRDGRTNNSVDGSSTVVNTRDDLDAQERAGLLLMREEEKLARDVYLVMSDLYGAQVFKNIVESERSHMAAMKRLLDGYGIDDPVGDDIPGVFVDEDLQSMYETLVARGSVSLLDALYVGATIEDLDIRDIDTLIHSLSGNMDIAKVYENLLKGSRNHMRAFHSAILSNDGDYQPQYISQEAYDSIVNSATERGR